MNTLADPATQMEAKDERGPIDLLSQQMAEKTDQELLAMLSHPEDWTPAATDAAKQELTKRNVGWEHLVAELPPDLQLFTPQDIAQIARRQKAVIYAFLLLILETVSLIVASIANAGEAPGTMIALYLATAVLALVLVIRLSLSLRSGAGVVFLLGTLIPLFALCALLYLNNRATTLLRKHRATVGFLGASQAEIAKLLSQTRT